MSFMAIYHGSFTYSKISNSTEMNRYIQGCIGSNNEKQNHFRICNIIKNYNNATTCIDYVPMNIKEMEYGIISSD